MLEWASNGADTATIQWVMPSGHLSTTRLDVRPTGSISYQIPADAQTVNVINLYVSRTSEPAATASSMLSIKLGSATDWFFTPAPQACPDLLRTSNAIEQRFERGSMLWLEEFYWSDSTIANNRTVYVFIKDKLAHDDLSNKKNAGYFRVFTDEWDNAQPVSEPQSVAPADLYQPVRSFGHIWRKHPEIQELLGWAVDKEIRSVAKMQADTAHKYPHLYIQTQDQSLIHLWPINYLWETITTNP